MTSQVMERPSPLGYRRAMQATLPHPSVGALIRGSIILVRETRLAVRVLQERAAGIRRRLEQSR